jgi:hypothetical protein
LVCPIQIALGGGQLTAKDADTAGNQIAGMHGKRFPTARSAAGYVPAADKIYLIPVS